MAFSGLHNSKRYRVRGFSLIEMMIVLAVLAVLLLVAAPGFQELIRNNRLVSEVYALRAVLSNARSEAMARRTDVIVCPLDEDGDCTAGNDWSLGYKSYVNDPNDPFQFESREAEGVQILFDAGNTVQFDSRGAALASAGSFVLCDGRGVEDARGLILAPIGSVRSATDDDSPADDIVNAHVQADGSITNVVAGDCP